MSISISDDVKDMSGLTLLMFWLSCQLSDIPKSLAGKFLVGEKMGI